MALTKLIDFMVSNSKPVYLHGYGIWVSLYTTNEYATIACKTISIWEENSTDIENRTTTASTTTADTSILHNATTSSPEYTKPIKLKNPENKTETEPEVGEVPVTESPTIIEDKGEVPDVDFDDSSTDIPEFPSYMSLGALFEALEPQDDEPPPDPFAQLCHADIICNMTVSLVFQMQVHSTLNKGSPNPNCIFSAWFKE